MISYTSASGQPVTVNLDWPDDELEAKILQDAAEPEQGPLMDLFAAKRELERQWNAEATPEQHAIGYGDCWTVRIGTTTVYGTVLTPAQVREAAASFGACVHQVADTLTRVEAAYARGWRYGVCASEHNPDGEYGAYHVAEMTPLPVAEYDAARWANWRPVPPATPEVG